MAALFVTLLARILDRDGAGEEQQNEELLRLSNQLLELTRAIHASTTARATKAAP